MSQAKKELVPPRNKSFTLDVLNNEFDRPLKSSLTNVVIEYTHIFCKNIKFDKTVSSNLIIIVLYKSSNQYVSNYIWEFFYPFQNSLYWYRERVLKSLKRFNDKNGFTSYNETKNFFFTTAFRCTKLKTWRMNCMCHIVRTGENTCIIISLTITAIKKLNFLTRPDLAFSFFNKRSGNEIKRLAYNKLKVSYYCHQQVTFISYLIPCVKDKFFSYW